MIELTTTERARAALWMLETAAATERMLGQMVTVNAGPQLQRELDVAGLSMRSLRTAAAVALQCADGWFDRELIASLDVVAIVDDVPSGVLAEARAIASAPSVALHLAAVHRAAEVTR